MKVWLLGFILLGMTSTPTYASGNNQCNFSYEVRPFGLEIEDSNKKSFVIDVQHECSGGVVNIDIYAIPIMKASSDDVDFRVYSDRVVVNQASYKIGLMANLLLLSEKKIKDISMYSDKFLFVISFKEYTAEQLLYL